MKMITGAFAMISVAAVLTTAQAQTTFKTGDWVLYKDQRGQAMRNPADPTKFNVKLFSGYACANKDTYCLTAADLKVAPALSKESKFKDGDYVTYKNAQLAKVIGSGWNSYLGANYSIAYADSETTKDSVPETDLIAASKPTVDLTKVRADIVTAHNAARQNPATYLTDMTKAKPANLTTGSVTEKAWSTAIADFTAPAGQHSKAVGALTENAKLTAEAQKHADALVKNPGLGHSGMQQRITAAGYSSGAENLMPASDLKANKVVLGFIVDDGSGNVGRYGHRRAVMNGTYKYIGVGIGSDNNVVILYAN